MGFEFNIKSPKEKLKKLGSEAIKGVSQLSEDITKKVEEIDVSKLTDGAKERFESLVSTEKPQLFVEMVPFNDKRLEVHSAKSLLLLFKDNLEDILDLQTLEVNFKTVKGETSSFKASKTEELQTGLVEMFKEKISVFTVQIIDTDKMYSYVCLNLDEYNVKI